MVRKNFKQLILAIAKPLLWNSYRAVYKALEIVLSPCCTLSGSAVVACVEGGYSITITTNESIGFLGNGEATVVVDRISSTGDVTEPNQIVVNVVDVTAGTYDVDVQVKLPTSTTGNSGVYKSFTITDVVFEACA